jgi:hypothetical protein
VGASRRYPLKHYPAAVVRLILGTALLLGCAAARAELSCEQLGAIARTTVELRNQGASLTRLLADAGRGEMKNRFTAEELEVVKQVIRLTFDSTLAPEEVLDACKQGGAIVPPRKDS